MSYEQISQEVLATKVQELMLPIRGMRINDAIVALQTVIVELACKAATDQNRNLNPQNAEGIVLQSAVNGAIQVRKIAEAIMNQPKIEIAHTLPQASPELSEAFSGQHARR